MGPQFSFGHGLSYATFSHSDLVASPSTMSRSELLDGGSIRVGVMVTNTGALDGADVVQVYIRDPVASLSQPVRRLRGFRRIPLAPAETREVEFSLGADDLGFWTGVGDEYELEPGTMEIHVGGTLETTRQVNLEITEG